MYVSDWQKKGELSIAGNLSVSDSSYFHDQFLTVDLEGMCNIELKYMYREPPLHIAAVRVLRGADASRGGLIGHVTVDFGQIAICDRVQANTALQQLGTENMNVYFSQLDTAETFSWAVLPGEARIALVRPGFGDGSYPAYPLLAEDGAIAGVEVDCMIPTDE